MNEETADAIYTLLVKECGANEFHRETFIYSQSGAFIPEWRFMGSLGFGGKFYRDFKDGKWWVGCYREDDTPARESMIQTANARLTELHERLATE